MAKVLHFTGFVKREDGLSVTPEQMEKIVRKLIALMGRFGCTFHSEWRIGDPPEMEDILG